MHIVSQKKHKSKPTLNKEVLLEVTRITNKCIIIKKTFLYSIQILHIFEIKCLNFNKNVKKLKGK